MSNNEKHHANWAEWAINHRQLVYFFAVLVLIMGMFSFKSLGRSEDPSFAVKQMVISAAWPGASAKDVEMHLTNTLEKQIQSLPQVKKITSYSRRGVCVISVGLMDEVSGNTVRQRWLELRNIVNDGKKDLPSGTVGPFYNDRFDDVYLRNARHLHFGRQSFQDSDSDRFKAVRSYKMVADFSVCRSDGNMRTCIDVQTR